MKKYVGISELSRRLNATVGLVLVSLVGVGVAVMLYQDHSLPNRAWITVAAIAGALDFLFAAMLLFPRIYLTVDLERRTATFVEKGTRKTMPLADLKPLYLDKSRRYGHAHSPGGPNRPIGWARVRSAAAPVVFFEAHISESDEAERALDRLNKMFDFTNEGRP